MRVGTKLALGGTLAVLPLVGGLVYTVSQVQALAEANAAVSRSQYRAAQLALNVLRGLEASDEYQRKLAVTGDPGYRHALADIERGLDGWLTELSGIDLSPGEQAASQDLQDVRERQRQGKPAPPPLARAAVERLLTANRKALDEHRLWAEERSRQTTRVTVGIGVAAVAVSLLIMGLLARALQRPLHQLICGTRAVAKGDFDYRAAPFAHDELGELARAFNQMVDALGALERLKAELVSRVSHELRTPLVAMVETNRILLDEIPGPINGRQRRMLELHAGAAERLTAMIGDLLDLSTVEGNMTLDRKPVDVIRLTEDVTEQLAPIAAERALQLDVGFAIAEAVVRCDGRRFQQVVQNFVDNAFAHSPSGGVVHVGIAVRNGEALPEPVAEKGRKPFVLLRVDDEGEGVPEEMRERIFDKFVQGAEARRGVGLGLAICREIVTAHGGRIGVEDSVLGGASFLATFPVTPEESARAIGGAA